MKTTTWALILGAASLAASGSMTACGSSSGGNSGGGSGGSSGGSGSSSGATDDSGVDATGSSSGSGSGSGSSSGSTTDGGSSSGCKADPTLHPGTGGSIFCGYTDAGSFNCPTGQECCLGGTMGTGYAPEMCATFGATCTNGTGPLPIECNQPQDCAANGMANAVCCLWGGATAPAPVSGCDSGDLKSTKGSGIKCEMPTASTSDAGSGDGGASDAGMATGGSCATGEMQVCEAPGDCPTGKTCTPIRWKLYEIGVCL